jgi:hypothetical protein
MKFTLSIPQPCSENWEQMTPTGCGRHCAACDKVVIDFTKLSDREIGKLIAKRGNEKLCGRFESHQLMRAYVTPSVPWLFWQKPLRTFFSAFFLASVMAMQAKTSSRAVVVQLTEKVEHSEVTASVIRKDMPLDSTHTVYLKVMDDHHDEALVYVPIKYTWKGTTYTINTNLEGIAEIQLEGLDDSSSIYVEVVYMGYDTITKRIPIFAGSPTVYTLCLKPIISRMGGEIVVRKSSLAERIKYRMRRMFSRE